MDRPIPIDAVPLRTIKPEFEDDDNHSETDENTSTPPPPTPLVVSPLRMVVYNPAFVDVNDEIPNTTTTTPPRTTTTPTSPPLDVSPLQTRKPFDESNNDSYDADAAGPSTMPMKTPPRTTTTPTSPPLDVSPIQTRKPFDESNNDSYDADAAGPSTMPMKTPPRTTTTPTSPPLDVSPLQTRKPFDESNNDSYDPDAAGPSTMPKNTPPRTTTTPTSPPMVTPPRTTTTPTSPPMVTPQQTRKRPFDESNNDSYDADAAGPSTMPKKRGRGRPKGSKNFKPSKKKLKQGDPNSKFTKRCPSYVSGITAAEIETGNREVVESVMLRYDAVKRRLLQRNKVKDAVTTSSTICKVNDIKTNTKKRIGLVPGVEVGDIFYYWGEMYLVGLHIQTMSGIDYLVVEDGKGLVATSVVTSGHYNDQTDDVDSLVYTGHGGKDKNGQPRDQRLERGNLALSESCKIGNEVRVIRGKEDPEDKLKKIYIYDGLYFVSDFRTVKGNTGCEEFKFLLKRKPGQLEGYGILKLAEDLRKNGWSSSRNGFILEDLSNGKESIPITLVNEVDEDDKSTPPSFEYVISQSFSNPRLDCVCLQRNEGELPYNNNVLVCRKPLIFECSFSCKNRVILSGLKIHMQVFKTANCGWGLRSWNPIRAGTFICEFYGVNKTKEEVEEDDDYLFDSSRIFNRVKWNYEPELVGEDAWEPVSDAFPPEVLISAKDYGNVGRFMNHSCSPNVFWQLVKCEMNNESHVRVGFFAMKHIPPLTELTYDYGVSSVEKIGEDETVFNGKKVCLCGSVKCRGSFG